MALAIRAGIDPRRFLDVVNASSGTTWIFGDRMARAVADDYAPRAAVNLLTKDSGIAVEAAAALAFDAPLARAAHEVLRRAVDAGHDEDDGALLKLYLDAAARG